MADYSALTAPPPATEAKAGTDYSLLTRRSPSVGEDVVRSGLSGLQRGVVGLLGLHGDIRSLATRSVFPRTCRLVRCFLPELQRQSNCSQPMKVLAARYTSLNR